MTEPTKQQQTSFGNAWLGFLKARHTVIHALSREGYDVERMQRAINVDPGQVVLLLATTEEEMKL